MTMLLTTTPSGVEIYNNSLDGTPRPDGAAVWFTIGGDGWWAGLDNCREIYFEGGNQWRILPPINREVEDYLRSHAEPVVLKPTQDSAKGLHGKKPNTVIRETNAGHDLDGWAAQQFREFEAALHKATNVPEKLLKGGRPALAAPDDGEPRADKCKCNHEVCICGTKDTPPSPDAVKYNTRWYRLSRTDTEPMYDGDDFIGVDVRGRYEDRWFHSYSTEFLSGRDWGIELYEACEAKAALASGKSMSREESAEDVPSSEDAVEWKRSYFRWDNAQSVLQIFISSKESWATLLHQSRWKRDHPELLEACKAKAAQVSDKGRARENDKGLAIDEAWDKAETNLESIAHYAWRKDELEFLRAVANMPPQELIDLVLGWTSYQDKESDKFLGRIGQDPETLGENLDKHSDVPVNKPSSPPWGCDDLKVWLRQFRPEQSMPIDPHAKAFKISNQVPNGFGGWGQ